MSRSAPERIGVLVAWALAFAVVGAVGGLLAGLATPTHVQIAGTDATIRVDVGRAYDELQFTGLLTGKRTANRTLFGEPVGVSVQLELDTSTFLNVDGSFDARVLPAYIQTYSNPEQLAHDVRDAIALHLLRWMATGAAAGAFLLLLRRGYVAWRRRQDAQLPHSAQMRYAALAYRAPERRLARRAVVLGAILATLGTVPGSGRHVPAVDPITPTPLLDGTPLAGAEVGGPLLPAFDAAGNYIRKYFADTNTYYDEVRAAVLGALDSGAVTLPSGPEIAQVGFVTDRHCNTGMDRVVVALLQNLGATVLVSAGDDAFSGTFQFESACTAGLASLSDRAHISDVFVGGNHDSPTTLEAEQDQGIEVLDGKLVTVDDLTFAGLPDPRTSRYGQGILPDSPEVRERLVADQGAQAGALACDSAGPVIVVLHDLSAGFAALDSGCGKAVLALTGHAHQQQGPDTVTLPDGTTGYLFVGASTGGAPSDSTIEQSFASNLTVGPLHNVATVNVVSVNRSTGRLVGITECHVHPDLTITFEQQLAAP